MAIAGLFVFDRTTFVCLALILYGTLSLLAPPWFVSLRAHIPVLGWFRFPQREFFLAQFAVAVLAARGISLFVDQRGSRWRTGAAAAAGIACMSFGAWYRAGHDSATVAVGGAIILLLAWTLARSERHSAAATVSVLLALLLAYDTVGFSRNSLELPYANDGSRVFSEAQDFYQRLGDLAGPQRVAMLARSDRQLTLKNAQLFGIYSPFDYEPLSPSVHEQCYVHAEPDYPVAGGRGAPRRYFGQPRNRDRSLLLVYPLKRCLDLLSVDVAVVPTRLSQHANIREQWRDIGQAVADIKSDLIGRLDFLRNPNALPRAYAVYDAECLPAGREQWQRLLSPEFDPQTSVVLEQSAGCSERDNAQPARGPDVRIVTLEPMRVRLQTDMNRPGYAVLTDTYYPGWRARVNGESVKILRANGTVRAVRVPAGAVEIVFEYVPMSFYAGTGIAGLAGLFMCCSMWVSRRRAKMVNGRTSQETS